MATGSGLTRWDGSALHTFYLEDGLSYGGVRSLAIDEKGDLLVGTDGRALRPPALEQFAISLVARPEG